MKLASNTHEVILLTVGEMVVNTDWSVFQSTKVVMQLGLQTSRGHPFKTNAS